MTAPTRSATALTWRTVSKRRGQFLRGGALWDTYFVSIILLGILLQLVFDGIVAGRTFWYLGATIGAYAFVELVRRLIVHQGALTWVRVWTMTEMFLRGGMLRGQVSSGGRHAGPTFGHAGSAMARFRDDPNDVAWYTDSWIDVLGAGVQAAVAVAIMAAIDPWLTVVSVLPIAGIAATTRIIGHWITGAHRRHLEATSDLTATLRDVFAAQDTIRLYAARDDALGEVARRSARRSRAAVVDRVLTDSVRAVSTSLSGVAVGVMLLVAADDLGAGELSIGELALFVAYLRYMTFFPRMLGYFLTRHRQSAVAFERMGELAADGEPANLLGDLDLDIDREPDPITNPAIVGRPLERLDVVGLQALHDDGSGLVHADFTLEVGTLTVVTGHVGAGKTTLVRALLGLQPATGAVYWNGEEVDDLGAFMQPPHASYLPQTPRLFSDSLADNIELGAPGIGVDEALAVAGLTREVTAMRAGAATIVGPRGVRLSGGQRQRLALARAAYRAPELLVLDDLSSAVDADTELALWARMRAAGTTILAISNRPIAIATADQVLTVVDGIVQPR